MAWSKYEPSTQMIRETVNGVTTESSFPVWREWSTSSVTKRVKPTNLLANPTGHVRLYQKITSGAFTTQTGNSLAMDRYFAASIMETATEADNLTSRAQANILAKTKNVKWNAAVSFAEMRETLSFVKQVATGLATAYTQMRRGNLKALADLYRTYAGARGKDIPRALRHGSSNYLAFRYAVRPLVDDFQSALDELYNSNAKPVVRRVASSVDSDMYYYAKTNSMGYPLVDTRHASVSVRRVQYFTVDPRVDNWKRFGATNLPLVLWNVIPSSFIVDWFLPIGRYLSYLDVGVGVTVLTGTRAGSATHKSAVYVRNGVQSLTREEYNRTQMANLSVPRFQFSPSLGMTQAMDALALLTQVVTGRRS